jgi:two-component system response regulator MprA
MRQLHVNSSKEGSFISKRILVVEDEPAARQATQRYLEFCGYEVVAAASAAEALQKSARFRPQVVVCDCKLGDGNDGIEVARQIQGKFGSMVIFVTAWSFKDVREQFQGIDVTECLRKPVRLGRLADVIDAGRAQ